MQNNIFYLSPDLEKMITDRISTLKPSVVLTPDQIKGFRFRDNNYILFKMKQQLYSDYQKPVAEVFETMNPEDVDKWITWGINDAATTDAWYDEKSLRDAQHDVAEASSFGKFVFSKSDFEEFVDGSNGLLDKIEQEMKDRQYSPAVLAKAMMAVHLLADKIVQLGEDKQYRHRIPDSLNERIEQILNFISIKGIGENINDWNFFLSKSIESFITHFSVADIQRDLARDLTDPLEIRKAAMRHVKSIWELINEYEKKFKSTFDPSKKDQLNNKVKELEKGLGLYLKDEENSVAPVSIKSVDSDALLDMYEEIKNMPDGEEKQKKIREFERLNKILKSSNDSKILFSSREKFAGPTLDKPYFDFIVYEQKAKTMKDSELYAALKDINDTLRMLASERAKGIDVSGAEGWYTDEKHTYLKELNERKKR